jgi:hypothetical protein
MYTGVPAIRLEIAEHREQDQPSTKLFPPPR